MLEENIDFLLSAALKKCGNLEDASDLAQETLLSAILYLKNGKKIEEIKGWLLTVLNRRYYDMLRKRYKQPTVSIGGHPDLTDDCSVTELVAKSEEAETIRREISYLSRIYREVIVRHYFNGESVGDIATELCIPAGTVKSRLSAGRERLRKEINGMVSYEKQSFEPVELQVANSGMWGMNREPMSLVNNDLIAQNLLYLAYAEPVTTEQLSRAIGIPCAYVEPIIKKLIDNELMKQTGNKVYTDFLISTVEDRERYIPAQKQLVEDNFDLFWKPIQEGLNRLCRTACYVCGNEDQRRALELYFIFNCMDYGVYRAFNNIFNAEQIFPDRPNGGKWIAFGEVRLKQFKWYEHMELMRHAYAGERHVYLENYLGAAFLGLHVYDPLGFPVKSYLNYTNRKPAYDSIDTDYLKLLYIIHSDINPNITGFNLELLKSIPHLTECKILRYENGKPVVNIPVLSAQEAGLLWQICRDAQATLADSLKPLLTEYFKGKKQELPSHLTSVPLQKQYMWSENALLFAVLRCAMRRGRIYDGGYDNEIQCPYPMIMIIDKAL